MFKCLVRTDPLRDPLPRPALTECTCQALGRKPEGSSLPTWGLTRTGRSGLHSCVRSPVLPPAGDHLPGTSVRSAGHSSLCKVICERSLTGGPTWDVTHRSPGEEDVGRQDQKPQTPGRLPPGLRLQPKTHTQPRKGCKDRRDTTSFPV